MLYPTLFLAFQTEFIGRTGVVKIDSHGERTDFALEIGQLSPRIHGPKASTLLEGDVLDPAEEIVGTWSPRKGLLWRGLQTVNGGANGGSMGGARGAGLEAMIRQKSGVLTMTTVFVSDFVQMY